MDENNNDEKVYLGVQVPKKLKRKATIAAALLGINRSELVRRAIERFVEDNNKFEEELEQ